LQGRAGKKKGKGGAARACRGFLAIFVSRSRTARRKKRPSARRRHKPATYQD